MAVYVAACVLSLDDGLGLEGDTGEYIAIADAAMGRLLGKYELRGHDVCG